MAPVKENELRFSKEPVDVSDEEQKQAYIKYFIMTEEEADCYIALGRRTSTGDIIAVGTTKSISLGPLLEEAKKTPQSPNQARHERHRAKSGAK
jgi:hypothetical protein